MILISNARSYAPTLCRLSLSGAVCWGWARSERRALRTAVVRERSDTVPSEPPGASPSAKRGLERATPSPDRCAPRDEPDNVRRWNMTATGSGLDRRGENSRRTGSVARLIDRHWTDCPAGLFCVQPARGTDTARLPLGACQNGMSSEESTPEPVESAASPPKCRVSSRLLSRKVSTPLYDARWISVL